MMGITCKCSDKCAKYGLMVLRVVVGAIFLYSGWTKFQDVPGMTGFFAGAGIPSAEFMVYLVAGIEMLGGLALILGIYTCIAAALLTIVMLVATYVSRATPMLTYPLTMAASSFALFTTGPGAWALGGCCKKCDACTDGTCTTKH